MNEAVSTYVENFMPHEIQQIGERMTMVLKVEIADLGENNTGKLGPDKLPVEKQQELIEDLAASQYELPASRTIICADARLTKEQKQHAATRGEVSADPQIGGGIVVSETSADLMEPNQTKPLSTLAKNRAEKSVADKIVPVVHGDEDHGSDGCGAKKNQRQILVNNAANIDIVGPRTWAFCQALGLDKYISQDDVVKSIINGKENAEKDELFDVSTKQLDDIVIAAGGRYDELLGKHKEGIARVSLLEDTAFAKGQFGLDHPDADAFGASFGFYKKMTFERASLQGETELKASLQIMRVIAFNIGLLKVLGNENLRVGVISAA